MRPSALRVARRWLGASALADLVKYLQKEDWEKALEVVKEWDGNGDLDRFTDWVQEEYGAGSNDPGVQRLLADPENAILDMWPEDFGQGIYEEFYLYGEWQDPRWASGEVEVPSWFNLSAPKLIPKQWLIHFTNEARAIACKGFKYGNDDYTRLGGRATQSMAQKKTRGRFNFAYSLADQDYRKGTRYAYEAVMFQAAGVRVWHGGDREWQVIFLGKTAQNRVPISEDFGLWYANGIGATGKRDEDGFDSLDKAVQWVQANFGKYKRLLLC